MLKQIIFALATISLANSRCLEGCLRCSPDNKCLYCDTLQGYKISNRICIKTQVLNCQLQDDFGGCLKCNEDFYWDSVLSQCTKILSELKITDCIVQSNQRTCSLCKEGFFLKNGACEKSSAPITNCLLENFLGKCERCKSGFLQSIDKKTCVTKPEIVGCASYSHIKCKKCVSNFILNANRYLNILYNLESNSQITQLSFYRRDIIEGIIDFQRFNQCERTLVSNCEVYRTFDTCKKCANGYFLNKQQTCDQNPLPIIDQCKRYNSLTSCNECNQGFIIEEGKCIPVIPIENCQVYDSKDTTTHCTQCIDGFYLSADNLCSMRTDLSQIDLCQKLSIKFEKCDQCVQGFIPTYDGFKCLQQIPFCGNYEFSNKNNNQMFCQTCQNGYFYNQTLNVCIQGTDDFCFTYQRTQNFCTVCEPKFYLQNNFCFPSEQRAFCQEYDPVQPRKCAKCDQHNFLFSRERHCVQLQSIPYCESYLSKTTCQKCLDGYYLENPSECVKIPSHENCLQKDSLLNCSKCIKDFGIYSGKCFKIDEKFKNCEKQGLNIFLNDLQCNSCIKNYVPIEFKKTFTCQDRKYIDLLFFSNQNKNLDPDCQQYQQVGQLMVCLKCANNRVLVNGTCRENCQIATQRTLYKHRVEFINKDGDDINESFRLIKTNICEETIPNCEIASLDVNQNFYTPRYVCEKCVNGYLPVMNAPGLGEIFKNIPQEKILQFHMPQTSAPGVTCQSVTNTQTILGKINQNKFIDFCEYYSSFAPNIFGCTKCVHGSTGKVIQIIKNCNIYNEFMSCQECDENYYLNNTKECKPIQAIQNCIKYSKTDNTSQCVECLPNYYVNNNICVIREISLNKKNCTLVKNLDDCVCINQYIQNPSDKNCLKFPDNCTTVSGVVNGVVNCTVCDSIRSYLSGSICLIGTVMNCGKYSANANTCLKCSNGFYLQGSLCIAHTSNLDSNCLTWNQSNKNVCQKCSIQSTKFQKVNECQELINNDPNCLIYQNKYSCQKCKDNFYLNNISRRCLAIPASKNCLKMEVVDLSDATQLTLDDYITNEKYLHTCIQCQLNYYKRTRNLTVIRKGTTTPITLNIYECVDWLSSIRGNCSETNINGQIGMGEGTCYGCNENFIPLDWTNKFICIDREYLKERKNGFIQDPNCLQYEYDTTRNINCLLCVKNYFLQNNECVQTCSSGSVAVIYDVDNYKVKRNFCKTGVTAITNCKLYVQAFKYAGENVAAGYGCFQCQSNYINVEKRETAIADNLGTFLNSLDQIQEVQHYDEVYPLFSCTDSFSTSTVRGITNSNKKIDKCAVYYLTKASSTIYGCLRCQFGYSGRVVLFSGDDFSHLESCELIYQCDTTIRYGGTSLNVNFLSNIGPLTTYLPCHKCLDSRILVTFLAYSGTTSNSIPGLKQFTYKKVKDSTNDYLQLTTDTFPEDLYQTMCWDSTKFGAANAATDSADYLYMNASAAITEVLPANCAVHALNISQKGLNETGAPTIGCLACLPGFYPNHTDLYFPTSVTFIKTCTQIVNCTNSTYFNRCDNCIMKYIVETNKINFNANREDECAIIPKTTNSGCFAGISTPSYKCYICDPGYDLDPTTNTCTKIVVPSCQNNKVNFYDDFNNKIKIFSDNFRFYAYLASRITNQGCLECERSTDVLYKLVNNDENMKKAICSQFQDIANAFSSAFTTSYLNIQPWKNVNCKRYGYKDNNFICMECIANYLLFNDYTCESYVAPLSDLLPNCIKGITKTNPNCLICAENYVNIGGLCRINNNQTSYSANNYVDQNCQIFSENSQTTHRGICQKCKPNFYVSVLIAPFNKCTLIPSTATNCIDFLDNTGCIRCAVGYGLIEIKAQYGTAIQKICVKMDNTSATNYDHDTNCSELVGSGDTFSLKYQRLKCLKCKDNFVMENNVSEISYQQKCYQVVTPIENCSQYDSPTDEDITTSIPNIVVTKTYRCTQCSNQNTHYLNEVNNLCVARTNSVIPNCTSFNQYSDRCVTCSTGYQLRIDGSSCENFKTNSNFGYLDTCREIENCNSKIICEGLNAQLSSIYSCHSCTNSTQIPFAGGFLTLNKNAKGLEIFNGSKQFNPNFLPYRVGDITPESSEIQCLNPVKETFGITDSTLFQFPDKCGLGFLDFSNLLISNTHDASHSKGNDVFDRNKATIRCAVCKPKFKPTKQQFTFDGVTQELGFLTIDCTEITNCESSSWFNACTQCAPGYSYGYNQNQGILFDTCVAVANNKSCLAYDTIISECVYCKKGNYLNQDGICEEINPANCQRNQFIFQNDYNSQNLLVGLFLESESFGCKQCEPGYISFYKDIEKICVYSQYHVNNTFIANSFFIQNCKNYKIDSLGFLDCEICDDNFIPGDNKKCNPVSALANCTYAVNATICKICAPLFVLKDDICVSPTVQNCDVFETIQENCPMCINFDQICVQCKPEFYLQGNQCIQGEVKNCLQMINKVTCEKCQNNFTLVTIQGGKNMCYPTDQRFNCKIFDALKLQSSILSCTQCKDSTFILSNSQTDFPQTSCMQFSFVENCQKYQNNPIAIADSTFNCVECSQKTFLNNGLCVNRVNLPEECIKFDPLADKCIQCFDGFFVSDNGQNCVAYPQGILGCEIYFSKNSCMKCQAGFYLKGQKCNKIITQVENCVDYEDEGLCQKCSPNFFNIKGICVAVLAQNCATYESINACGTCSTGKKFNNEQGLINCVDIGIANCLQVENKEPFNCTLCEGKNFPNGQLCQAVVTEIPKCVVYKAEGQCLQCEPKTVLKTEGNACLFNPDYLRNIDLNCSNNVIFDKPVCNSCLPGYYFTYEKCLKCPESVMSQGCFTCDPNNPNNCLICATGWVQSPEGFCVKPIEESTGLDSVGRSL